MSGPAPVDEPLVDNLMRRMSHYQFALQVVYELAVYGPGNAGQIAERMTMHDDERGEVSPAWVDEAFAELDQWALLDYAGLEEADPVSLVGRAAYR